MCRNLNKMLPGSTTHSVRRVFVRIGSSHSWSSNLDDAKPSILRPYASCLVAPPSRVGHFPPQQPNFHFSVRLSCDDLRPVPLVKKTSLRLFPLFSMELFLFSLLSLSLRSSLALIEENEKKHTYIHANKHTDTHMNCRPIQEKVLFATDFGFFTVAVNLFFLCFTCIIPRKKRRSGQTLPNVQCQ